LASTRNPIRRDAGNQKRATSEGGRGFKSRSPIELPRTLKIAGVFFAAMIIFEAFYRL
jgi:hypothetical protein